MVLTALWGSTRKSLSLKADGVFGRDKSSLLAVVEDDAFVAQPFPENAVSVV